MRYFFQTILLGALVVLSTASLPAQDGLDMSFKGFVDTYHAMRIQEPNDWMSSRSRVRGEFRLEKDKSGAFVSANLIYNALLNDQTGFQLREAYLYWGNSDWDIRAGNQIITWGVADYIDDHGNNQGCALVGLDWYPGADWTLSAQFNQTYESGVQASLATLRITKALFNNALTLSTFAYADVKDLGVFNRFSADWAATDQIHAIVGFDYFYAEDGMFKAYKDNSEIWIKLKYNF